MSSSLPLSRLPRPRREIMFSLGDAGTFAGIGGVFGDMLVRNHTLTHLNLEGNRLGPTAGVAIAKALHRNISIVNLNLEDNRSDWISLMHKRIGMVRGGGG